MRMHNQTIFYIEHLQADRAEARYQFAYVWLVVKFPAIIIGILVCLVIILLALGYANLFVLFEFRVLGGFIGGCFSEMPLVGFVSPGNKSHVSHCPFPRSLTRWAISAGIGLVLGLNEFYAFNGQCLTNTGIGIWYDFSQFHWFCGHLRQYSSSVYGILVALSCRWVMAFRQASHKQSSHTSILRAKHWGRWLPSGWFTLNGNRALLTAAVLGGGLALSNALIMWLTSRPIEVVPGFENFGLRMGLWSWLNDWPTYVLYLGFVAVLISVILNGSLKGIHLVERLHWTWRSLHGSLFRPRHLYSSVVLAGLILFLFVLSRVLSDALSLGLSDIVNGKLSEALGDALDNGLNHGLNIGLSAGLSAGLSIGLIHWLLVGLFQGIAQEQVIDQDRQVFNQGIRRSMQNSGVMALLSGGILAVIGPLNSSPLIDLSIGLRNWLIHLLGSWLSLGLSGWLKVELPLVVSGGLLVCAISGGLTTWRHYALRWLLHQSNTFPWRASLFLDDATARFLLRRVGSGYSFSHRLLLEHLADDFTEKEQHRSSSEVL